MDFDEEYGIHGASGSGTMPMSSYLYKNEITPMNENPYQTDNYMRGLLSDFGTEETFLESDTHRYETHADSKISLLQNGAVVTDDPYLPDGTFLDFEFLEKDPRGTVNDPDMNKYKEQSMARGKYRNFYPDADYSITESHIPPAQMIANKAKLRDELKRRLYIFDDSLDGMNLPHTYRPEHVGTRPEMHTMDGTLIEVTDLEQRQRSNPIAMLSNDPAIASRHSTTDHRFKVSKYGQVRAINVNGDISGMRYETDTSAEYEDSIYNVLNTKKANIDMAKLIAASHNVSATSGFTDSDQSVLRSAIQKKINIKRSEYEDNFSNSGNAINKAVVKPVAKTRINNSIYANEFAKSIEVAAKSKTQRSINANMNRQNAHIDLTDDSNTVGQRSIQGQKPSTANETRTFEYAHDIPENVITPAYGKIKPKIISYNNRNADVDVGCEDSVYTQKKYSMAAAKTNHKVENYKYDHNQLEFDLPGARSHKGSSSKLYASYDHDHNDLADI